MLKNRVPVSPDYYSLILLCDNHVFIENIPYDPLQEITAAVYVRDDNNIGSELLRPLITKPNQKKLSAFYEYADITKKVEMFIEIGHVLYSLPVGINYLEAADVDIRLFLEKVTELMRIETELFSEESTDYLTRFYSTGKEVGCNVLSITSKDTDNRLFYDFYMISDVVSVQCNNEDEAQSIFQELCQAYPDADDMFFDSCLTKNQRHYYLLKRQ